MEKRSKGKSNATSKDTEPPRDDGPVNVDEELRKLYVDALASGMPEKTVRQCFLSEVYAQSKVPKPSRWRLYGALVLPVVLAVFYRGSINDYFYYQLYDSMCLIDSNPFVMEMSRPIANCSAMCAGLENGVPVVDNITAEDFLVNYVRTARPLLVTGVASKWKALDVFSYDYFKKLYTTHKKALSVNEEECQFFTYGSNITTLTELFDMSESRARLEGEPWYIGWSNCEEKVKNILRENYEHPSFIPFMEADSENLDWIFMGGSGPGAFVHLDNVEKPSWQAQIKGSKTWTLHPVPECESQCPSQLDVLLRKGDIIFVDTNKWYHSTKIHPGDMSITIGSEYSDDV